MLARSWDVSQARSAFPVYFPKRRCVGERALLVGDAARMSEPMTGEGIYFALRSGTLAAKTLDDAFACGDLSAGRLRSHERRCNRQFRRRMAVNGLMRFAIYRPALFSPLIRCFAGNGRWLDSLVGAVCAPEPLR
jgi:flavin-dependent dehydrogenase